MYQLPDGVYGTVSGILRGLGRQPQLLWVNLTGFWAVGMVTAVALTFPLGLGELGLWWGVLSGITATGAPPEKTLSSREILGIGGHALTHPRNQAAEVGTVGVVKFRLINGCARSWRLLP